MNFNKFQLLKTVVLFHFNSRKIYVYKFHNSKKFKKIKFKEISFVHLQIIDQKDRFSYQRNALILITVFSIKNV